MVLGCFLGLASGCAGPATIAIQAPKPGHVVAIPDEDRGGVRLQVVDARLPGNQPDRSRAIEAGSQTPGAVGAAAISNAEPIQALVERSVRDQLWALGFEVREAGPARLTIEVREFERRRARGNVQGGNEAAVYLGILVSSASGADCLLDIVNIRVHEEDVGAGPGATAQAALEKALDLAMRYVAERSALRDALMRAVRSKGASAC